MKKNIILNILSFMCFIPFLLTDDDKVVFGFAVYVLLDMIKRIINKENN